MTIKISRPPVTKMMMTMKDVAGCIDVAFLISAMLKMLNSMVLR